jgi:hypothetical protein
MALLDKNIKSPIMLDLDGLIHIKTPDFYTSPVIIIVQL